MKIKYFLPTGALCFLCMIAGCGLDNLGKVQINYEEEPEPGDVVVPADPDEIPEQGTTKPEGSGGVVSGDPNENITGGGQTGNGSVNTETLALSFISPSTGDVNGGYEVRVRGTQLNKSGIVKFGSLQSPSQIYVNRQVVRAIVPPGKPGCVDVSWTQDGETLTIHNGFCYTETIGFEHVEPKNAVEHQITQVVIEGSGFDDKTRIYFNSGGQSLPLIDPVVDSSSQIHGYMPPLDAGNVQIVMTNGISEITLDDAMKVLPQLKVSSVDPSVIPAGQSSQISLQGKGFDRDLKINIAGQILRPSVTSSTAMTVNAPILNAGNYDIVVYDSNRQERLKNALHYYENDGTPELLAVSPDFGSSNGGEQVRLTGHDLPTSGNVLFGTKSATITSRNANSWEIKTPVSDAGIVDVKLGSMTLKDAFEFIQIPTLASISPDTGVVGDGFKATVTGTGFDENTRIFFGDFESQGVTVVNGGKLEVIVPPGAGVVPIRVVKGKADVETSLTFTYRDKVQITGINPQESVVTGQTPIQLFGTGFTDGMTLKIDGKEVSYSIQSGNLMSFTAPAHDEGKAVVSVCDASLRCDSVNLDYYVASNGITGGYGGNIDGELHVTVLTVNTAVPIPGATVYVGSDIDSALTGTTDELGRVSFFGVDLKNAQIVIACAPEHSCNTMQPVNASYVTLLLEDWHANDEPSEELPEIPPEPPEDEDWTINPIASVTIPYEPKQPYLMGHVRGMGKVDLETYPGYQNVAFVKQSALSTYDYSYDDDEEIYLVRNENGMYRLKARKGELAVAAICGLYNEGTKDFIPKFMGIVRHQMVTDGKILENDIECNIPLDQTQMIKLIDPPLNSGPDIVMAHGFIFLGNEGYLGGTIGGRMEGFMNGHSSTELVVASRLPRAVDALSDMEFAYVVGAYTLINPGSGSLAYTSPSTVFYSYNNPPNQDLIEVGPAAPIPVFVTPDTENVLKTGRIAWTVEYPENVDFYAMTIRLYSYGNSVLLYQFYLPGSATTAEFVPYHTWPADKSGQLYIQLTAYKSIRSGFDFNLFSTAELRYNYIHSSASSTLVIRDVGQFE